MPLSWENEDLVAIETDTDRRHLARAIDLAQRGRGRVSPNPMVGAVLGRDREIIGEGFHANLGGPHAEVEAIAAAGDQYLDGATLYVSLEPCCHEGRTPPCTDAIREAGIRRVVVASDDPSEHANGRGLGILRDDGVEVRSGGGALLVKLGPTSVTLCGPARLIGEVTVDSGLLSALVAELRAEVVAAL